MVNSFRHVPALPVNILKTLVVAANIMGTNVPKFEGHERDKLLVTASMIKTFCCIVWGYQRCEEVYQEVTARGYPPLPVSRLEVLRDHGPTTDFDFDFAEVENEMGETEQIATTLGNLYGILDEFAFQMFWMARKEIREIDAELADILVEGEWR
ncbi:hypothetical protein LTR85_002524 [Meristemomyces frigidus]|nr:hypothetical protein LTR85_002524 [Meristemomyces frigidus]